MTKYRKIAAATNCQKRRKNTTGFHLPSSRSCETDGILNHGGELIVMVEEDMKAIVNGYLGRLKHSRASSEAQ
jgi:hypothetical protein